VAEKLINQPPMTDFLSSAHLQTPLDTEGRFSLSEVVIVDSGEGFYTPIDQWGRPLSPMETETDVPLPIISYGHRSVKPNKHYGYYFERHYLKGPEPIRALRYSRLQRVNPYAHEVYHGHYFGTLMPSYEPTAARGVLLGSAGLVPRLGVVIRGDDTTIRELTNQERDKLRRPNVFLSEQTRKIGNFLMRYALDQRLDHVKQSQIEEFLSLTPRKIAKNERLYDRKLRLGLRITNIAISVAVDPVEDEYQSARHNLALRAGTPRTAWKLAKGFVRGLEKKHFDTLEKRLIDNFGEAA
jgi:hypothetical protein